MFERFYEFAQDIVSVSELAFLTLSSSSDIFSVLILASIYSGTLTVYRSCILRLLQTFSVLLLNKLKIRKQIYVSIN